jgi:predicted RNA-binding Zn ribbon-like protein
MDQRPPALFVAGAPGLDFLNSIAMPVDSVIDWLDDGEGYLRWLEQAGLAPADVLRNMRRRSLPGELDKVAHQARGLREWFRRFVHRHKGCALTAEALTGLAPLNRLLKRDETFSRIVLSPKGQGPLQLEVLRWWRNPHALLLPVAEAMAQLVCTSDFSHVKTCEGPTCTLLFVDQTRGHARRWCSMAICGNRAKQEAYRHRVKAHTRTESS